jgi:cytochrome P450
VSGLPGLPFAFDVRDFRADPLGALAAARERHGNVIAIRSEDPIFSRAVDCAGVVCVFGAGLQRRVLSDIDTFAMPLSAARRLGLDERLVNLNRGLHSMTAPQHGAHKGLLTALLGVRTAAADEDRGAWDALEASARDWAAGGAFALLGRLRELALRIATALFFGEGGHDGAELASLLQAYFFCRREASSPAGTADDGALDRLKSLGNALDGALRSYVDRCRGGDTARAGLFSKLALLESEPGRLLSADEVVGHLNILFISSTEPLAVALAWTLLLLSQLPRLRAELREEVRGVVRSGVPTAGELDRLVLLNRVLSESLRVLPPNAFMVRLTSRPAELGGFVLPAGTEVIVCPFLSHRDGDVFAEPATFRPDRWKQPPPSAFQYFPFGAGGHACAGKFLAVRMMKTALAYLLARYDVVLAADQDVDWRLHIQFMPAPDPAVTLVPAGARPPHAPGKLGGPVAKLLRFEGE